ncbi:MAG TPA: M23 family metallopeptidase, partial [Clostridia bacterium]|nr:M23 family metallopeptidase [Clostridia bacterium]
WPTTVRRITDSYGWRTHPITGIWGFHDGIDIAASMGSPIYATDSGTIVLQKFAKLAAKDIVYYYGDNYVFINHHNGIVSFYGHCSARASGIKEGASVQRGQVIAYVGSKGKSTAAHLHFGVYVNGKAQNPLNYLH